MAREGETTKSWYLTFDPYGLSTINWRPKGGPISEPRRYPKGHQISDPRELPTTITTSIISEESFKILTHTSRLGESHPTRYPKIMTQQCRLALNIYEY